MMRAIFLGALAVSAVTATAITIHSQRSRSGGTKLASNGRPMLPSAKDALIDNPDGSGHIINPDYARAIAAARLYPPTDLQIERNPERPSVHPTITAPPELLRVEPMMTELLGAFTLEHGAKFDWSKVITVRAYYDTWGPEFELTHEHGDTLRVARSIDDEFGAEWLYSETQRYLPGEPRPTNQEIANYGDFSPRWLLTTKAK